MTFKECCRLPLARASYLQMLDCWFESIVHYIRNRYTNGPTEGFNNNIKLIQRMAYGLRNECNRRIYVARLFQFTRL